MSEVSMTLDALEQHDDFIDRHIGPNDAEIQTMLSTLGLSSMDELIDQTVPAAIRSKKPLDLPTAQGERETLAYLKQLANKNKVFKSFIGMGYSDTITPNVVLRNILENPGWYTAYTPYQPEISQGRLEGLLNFQQMITDLTGMQIANASLLDEGTAAAEAMTLCKRSVKKNKANTFFIDAGAHPQTIDLVRTRAQHFGFEIVVGDPAKDLADVDVFGVLLQYPSTTGHAYDLTDLIDQIHAKNALAVVAADLMALCLLKEPGQMGADVVVGCAQRFGVPMGYGGPHAAFIATRDSYKRSLPGRLIGVSKDRAGKQALRMALQTREQHIRREKATSNICTAQALLAIMASSYAVYHGPKALLKIAGRIHRLTHILATGLQDKGFELLHNGFFDTITVVIGAEQGVVYQNALDAQMNLRRYGSDCLGISLDETTGRDDILALWDVFCGPDHGLSVEDIDQRISAAGKHAFADSLERQSAYLQHPVFNTHHSETEMLRYIKRLEDKDIALNRAMIPLGSCTMKLNATAEMIPVTWPEFANLHPFAPADQATGYAAMITELEQQLLACTGYDAISMQPNAGSQGEYAGLLAIKEYHEARGQAQRDVCLIPSSAHGTNPASAQMAGMKVVIVKCDDNGNVDIEDLQAQADKHADDLSCLMITYPSTHGVYEEQIKDICKIIHDHDGQVYLDGANLNALVGIAGPGEFGADVSHLNLHKTFCIPHGGGGPGMGPIGVKAHLAPHVPNHPVVPLDGPNPENGCVSAAPWGSAGILPISWTYVHLMGRDGLRKATEVAILNANYVARRLSPHFPVLYTGRNGLVAHECIIDIRPLKEASGISEEDIAKRLMDYGFHAPTMSFPVAGTLMIEPTESEALYELDRFIDAMISIRQEIAKVEDGSWPAADNPLVNAPHTMDDVTADWPHAYSREDAAFPVASLRDAKYWAPVNRIDNVYGDRNLFCSCPAVEDFAEDVA